MDIVTFKMDVDFICAAIEAADPPLAPLVASANILIDSLAPVLAPLVPSGLGVKAFLQAVFDQLNQKFVNRPFMLAFIKAIEAAILNAIPGAMPLLLAHGYQP